MTIDNKIKYYQENFKILDVIYLTDWTVGQWNIQWKKFEQQLFAVRKDQFESNERIIFVFNTDEYDTLTFENFFKEFIHLLFKIDISNFFAVLLTNNQPELLKEYFERHSPDPVVPVIDCYHAPVSTCTNSVQDTFCILPWNHLMVTAYQDIKTCCIGKTVLARADQGTLEDAWHSDSMIKIRRSLLNNSYHPNCTECYSDESHGKQSARQKSNTAFSKHTLQAKADNIATPIPFQIKYFDLRFTNLCNIRCRTCNHHSSSKWHSDTVKLDPSYNKPVLMKSGRTETDIWDQIRSHIDHVESVYFAGGEPLIMEEHYQLLDELERRGRFDVVIRYNTNFLQTKLKNREVFNYWQHFESVTVDASLDAMGPRAEYIRKDTDWLRIEQNRRSMIESCPNVIFRIMPTVSILNVWHLPDFHRAWVEQDLIKPQDVVLNTLHSPYYYRIDIATDRYKKIVQDKILAHCQWLNQYPDTEQIQKSYLSIINYMFADDNTQWLPEFWRQTSRLDNVRNENILTTIPELEALL